MSYISASAPGLRGVEPAGGMPQALAAPIAKEIAQWCNLAQSAKITLD
jgi:hypothetical protein